jgi:hypothetical protein
MNEHYKNIFITVPEAAIALNFLEGGALSRMTHAFPHSTLVLLVPEAQGAHCKEKYQSDHIVIESIPRLSKRRLDRALFFLNNLGFGSGTSLQMHRRGQGMVGQRVPLWLRTFLGSLLFRSRPFIAFLRLLYRWQGEHDFIVELFERYRPAMVFSTAMVNLLIDQPVCHVAVRRGIPLIGMVRNWDNLSGHLYLPFAPDRLLVQSEYLREEAIDVQRFDPRTISVVGFAQYDHYIEEKRFVDRETFMNQWQLDPTKKLIVYGAIGEDLFKNEPLLPAMFERMVKEGRFVMSVQFIYRPHPFFPDTVKGIEQMKHVRYDPGFALGTANARGWQFSDKERDHLVNLLRHTDVMVTCGSTLMIESAITGTPVVNIGFDPLLPNEHPRSPATLFTTFRHLVKFLAFGSAPVAYHEQTFVSEVNAYLSDRAKDAPARKAMLGQFGGQLDGKSIERIVTELTMFAERFHIQK